MPIPDAERTRNDVVDLLQDAAKIWVEVEDEHGNPRKESQLDAEQIYWSTRNVDNPHFGSMAKELLKLENMADEAEDHMMPERAMVFKRQIMAICKVYRKSIDAKSSETRMDKLNSKPNLIDKFLKRESSHRLTIDEKVKSSVLEAFKGKQKENSMTE